MNEISKKRKDSPDSSTSKTSDPTGSRGLDPSSTSTSTIYSTNYSIFNPVVPDTIIPKVSNDIVETLQLESDEESSTKDIKKSRKNVREIKVHESYNGTFLHNTIAHDIEIYSTFHESNKDAILNPSFKGHRMCLSFWCLVIRNTYFRDITQSKFKESEDQAEGIVSKIYLDFPDDIIQKFFEYVYLLPQPFTRRNCSLEHLVWIFKISFYYGCYWIAKISLDFIKDKIKTITDGIKTLSSLPIEISTTFLEIQNYPIDRIKLSKGFTILVSKILKDILVLFVGEFSIYSDQNMAFIEILSKDYYISMITSMVKVYDKILPIRGGKAFTDIIFNSIILKWNMIDIDFFRFLIDDCKVLKNVFKTYKTEEFLDLFSKKMIELHDSIELENMNSIWINIYLYGGTRKLSNDIIEDDSVTESVPYYMDR